MRRANVGMRSVVVGFGALVALTVAAVPAGASARPTHVAPAAPSGVSASSGTASSSVSWTAVTPPAGETITKYLAVASAPTATTRHCKAVSGATACSVPRLANGVRYSVSVQAFVGRRASPDSAPVTVVPGLAGAPTAVRGDRRERPVHRVVHRSDAGAFPVIVVHGDRHRRDHSGQRWSDRRRDLEPDHVTGLTIGDSYTFTVVARTGTGPDRRRRPRRRSVPVPVPGTPTDVTAVPGYGRAT